MRAGELVAFPTETVYGLGADAMSTPAVERIFRTKQRPANNPLIVHVADVERARRYTTNWTAAAGELARRFWPGPLTLVLPRHPLIAPAVSAGLDTVALRAPDHPLTLEVLDRFDGPLAGPSANRSTRISPTTAEHVRSELGESVAMILDGGPCAVGIESTVLDLCGRIPRILRPGAVTPEQIESVLGPIDAGQRIVSDGHATRSPGQSAVHYAPRAPTYRLTEEDWCRLTEGAGPSAFPRAGGDVDRRIVILSLGPANFPIDPQVRVIALHADPVLYARQLYAALRAADEMNPAAIWVQLPPDRKEWQAVRDRLFRATSSFT